MTKKVKYGMLMFEDHPYGRVVLSKLLANGHVPTVCVEERSATSAKRCKWYNRQVIDMAGIKLPTVDNFRETQSFKRVIVDDMNNSTSLQSLLEADLDVIFLGGAGIVKENIFSAAKFGTLNTHPGLLPYIRGSLPVAWSIKKDIPIGVTLHTVTDKLDCGPWIKQERVAVARGATFERIIYDTCTTAGDLFNSAIEMISTEGVIIEHSQLPQSAFGPNMKWSGTIENEAREKLASGQYAHYTKEEMASEENRSAPVVSVSRPLIIPQTVTSVESQKKATA